MKKLCSLSAILVIALLVGLSGCTPDPVTTTVTKTTTAPAQTISVMVTTTSTAQAETVTSIKTVTTTLSASSTTSTVTTSSTTETTTSSSTQPENDQTQQITSDDGKVQILNHEMIISGFGDRKVSGAVKNLTEEKLNAKITVEFYGADGTLINTQIEIVEDIYPGKTKRFEPLYSGDLRGSVVYYKIYVESV
ncbi:MAG: FxLYD domain-containing protein [Eubacteriales bacterium]